MQPTPSDSNARAVLDRIRAYLAFGIELNEGVLDFVSSTYGISPEDTAAIVQALESGEADPLEELLFFPAEDLQVDLENVLGGNGLDRAACAWIRERLVARPAETLFLIAPTQNRFSHALPAEGVDTYVSRLCLDWQCPGELLGVISRRFPAAEDGCGGTELRLRVLVRLRNAHLPRTPFQEAFLSVFFNHFPFERTDYLAHLDCLLGLLSETPDAPDAYDALMQKKFFYFRQLSRARKAKALLENSNMETLIMTGVRLPHMDTRDAVIAMERIDRMALFLFGRTEYIDGNPVAVDLGEITDTADAEAISRALSDRPWDTGE